MSTKQEAAARLGIHECTLVRWAEHGLIIKHAYNAHPYLYEQPGSKPPNKHCSRWNRLVDRAAAIKTASVSTAMPGAEGGAV
jgi:predicted site-specific integrase-resolvase